jgi:hypothetical protein
MVGFPLLLIPLAIVNILVFLMPGVSFTAPLATVALLSGARWNVTFADILVALGIVLILFEVLKASRPQGRYLTDHLLSLLALAGALAEFLLLPQFAGSVMFLLVVMMAVDFLAGISLRLRRAPAPVSRDRPALVPAAPERAERVEPVVPAHAAREGVEPAAHPAPPADEPPHAPSTAVANDR